MSISELIELENVRIYKCAEERVGPPAAATYEALGVLNDIMPEIAMSVHLRLLQDLFFSFVSKRFGALAAHIMPICFGVDATLCSDEFSNIPDADIPDLCERLHISFLNSRFAVSPRNRKVRFRSKERLVELGAVYTPPYIALGIIQKTMNNLAVAAEDARILDFACGTGRFYENVVRQYRQPAKAVLNNVYAVDIDFAALSVTRLKALSFFDTLSIEDCTTICKHITHRDALRKDTAPSGDVMPLGNTDLDGLTEGGFDAVVSNPPYLMLKPNKSKAGMHKAQKIHEQAEYFRNCGMYLHSIEGLLNLYQLSIERMLQMLKPDGAMGVICPSTLFGDVSASRLRKHLLLKNRVKEIRFFAEKIPLFENVNQATSIFFLQKGKTTDSIKILEENKTFEISLSLVRELFADKLEIPAIKAAEWKLLRKLSRFRKLKHFGNIRNRRGELDLSLCKKYITTAETPYRLVRGNMIGETCIKDINGEYVEEQFVATRSGNYRLLDFHKPRLVCQQISNIGQRKRLRFVFCDRKDILGNSCNYISADITTLRRLYIILNSSLLNWRFKITSSNNHINNYELDDLPIADLNMVDPSLHFNSQAELDEYVATLYDLSADEKTLVSI